MVFLHALGGIFGLLLVVAVGYALAARGWFPPECRKLLPRLVTSISLPPFLMCTIMRSFARDNLVHMLYGALLPLVAMVSLFGLAFVVGRLTRVQPSRFGLFCACASNPNTIFIGIPVNMALFGPQAVPYVLLYYFASTFFFWTVGHYAISHDQRRGGAPARAANAGRCHGAGWLGNLRQVLSAPMLGFLAGLALVLTGMSLPDFLFSAARTVGDLTTPLALIYIGTALQGMDLRHLRIHRDMVLALVARLVVSPLLVLALLPLFGLPELMGKVFVMQASLPVLMQVALLSAYYDTDPEFGSIMVSLSTLLSVITIPIYMTLLEM